MAPAATVPAKQAALPSPKPASGSAAASDTPPPIRKSLFEPKMRGAMAQEYQESGPYRHLVIGDLIEGGLLEATKEDLQNNIQATLKETDIYKVYQTGDLANIDGLSEEERALLPNLMKLRDALYSKEFRRLVAEWTGVGPLSGRHIDLSVNAYAHTGHLLCHDDVIGTRRVSYILYLVNKDWGSGEKSDGGALQLYPLAEEGKLGTPAFAPTKIVPAQWNQMVLFGVDPGRTFHDVQEVFNEEEPRLSISGWFHPAHDDELEDWPQEIIDQGKAHTEHFDALVATTSTLAQLESGGGDAIGDDSAPGPFVEDAAGGAGGEGQEELKLEDWVNPEYLQESMQQQCRDAFVSSGSTVQLHRFLRPDVAQRIADAARAADAQDNLGYQEGSAFDAGVRGGWRPVGPPHRQRMLRLSQDPPKPTESDDAIGQQLRSVRRLFSTPQFRELLQKVTGLEISGRRAAARRFRPGLDYTLATPQPWECGDEALVLDAVLCFVDDNEPYKEAAWVQDEVGGYQTYLGGDDSDEEEEDEGENEGKKSETDAGQKAKTVRVEKPKDAAVYRADEGGSLLSVSAACNALSLVLRDDAEVLSFIKYVSSAAPGSRFDVAAEYAVTGGGEDVPSDVEDEAEVEDEGAQEGGDAGEGGAAEDGPVKKRTKTS